MAAGERPADESVRDERGRGRRRDDVSCLEVGLDVGQLADRRSGDEEVLASLDAPHVSDDELSGAEADLEGQPDARLDLLLPERLTMCSPHAAARRCAGREPVLVRGPDRDERVPHDLRDVSAVGRDEVDDLPKVGVQGP